jgi:hypothetical protein
MSHEWRRVVDAHEALLDEALEESFPASDPISPAIGSGICRDSRRVDIESRHAALQHAGTPAERSK